MSLCFWRRFAVVALSAAFIASANAQITINEVLADNNDIINPDGSNSDWVELHNGSSQAVNLAGYSLTDDSDLPRKWVFPANVTIPGNGFLVVYLDSGRPGSTTSVAPLNAPFGLRASGDDLELHSTSQLVERVRFGPQAADFSIGRVPAGFRGYVLCVPTPGEANEAQQLGSQADLRINEWMASPSTGNDWFEIYNGSAAQLPVQLTGLYFTDNGDEPSPVAPLSFIGVGRNAFVQFFADNSTNDNEVDFGLSSNGDSISMFATGGTTPIDSVQFGAQAPDISQGRLPDGSANRTALTSPTPGESNLIQYNGLVVNELLSHTDLPLEDAIEFYNQTAAPIDISGWFLSDSRTELKKYQIPNGTVVPARGYLVLYQNQFGSGASGFSFNSARGDEIYLSQANAAGTLSGFVVFEEFEAAANGISFGRYETSVPGDYKFVAVERPTFGADNPMSVEQFRTGKGATNSRPIVGPVVINEIMYNPQSTTPDGSENTADEFIELRNITSADVLLFDPAHPENRWELRGGVDLTFPANATLQASAYALLVSFNPNDATQLNAFRTKYSVPQGVQIFGPYSGKINNGGDPVEIYRPDPPQGPGSDDPGFVPYIRVDKVNFRDLAPWPIDADGTGKSLQRKVSNEFGNDPINWVSGDPTAGRSNSPETPDQLSLGATITGVGLIDLVFASTPGTSYSVQYRNDLSSTSPWQTLVSTNATANESRVQDSTTTRPYRFYRLTSPAVP